MPDLCPGHAAVYATRAKPLERRVHRPGTGMKALAREAALVASQCPHCPDPEPR